ncbi:MAG TPA: hypothetical protein VFA10_14540 [Ktedonobacteraceae bacterium]|nr:hypothetical protein [Ktedonobacteraceae bacterium]
MTRKRAALLERPVYEQKIPDTIGHPHRVLVTAHYECHDALSLIWSNDRTVLSQLDSEWSYWVRGACQLCRLIAEYGTEREGDNDAS